MRVPFKLAGVSAKVWVALFFVYFFSNSTSSFAQVINDQLAQRLKLTVDAPFHRSNTTNCTVEWQCIHKALTAKCIEYHNDQWFEFKTNKAANYYVNIKGQNCRDIRGVQLLVIDGVPCQPKTYRLVACASLGTQDDIYLALDSLKSNCTYLLNVDGYLNDFCDFKIQVGSRPQGMPLAVSRENKQLTGQLTGNQVEIAWQIAEEAKNATAYYQVLRRHQADKKFAVVTTTPHLRNAYGDSKLTYSIQDTVSLLGEYQYRVVAHGRDSTALVIGEYAIKNDLNNLARLSAGDYISIKLNYKAGTPLSIYLFNAANKQFLKKTVLVSRKNSREIPFYVKQLKEKGITALEVKITDHKSNTSVTQIYKL